MKKIKFLRWITISVFLLYSCLINAQSTCQTAIQVSANGQTTSISESGPDIWIKYIPSEAYTNLTSIFNSNDISRIQSITIYEGDCNNLNPITVDTGFYDTSLISLAELPINRTYYYHLILNYQNNIAFNLTILSFPAVNIDCPNVYCGKNVNGSFEESMLSTDLITVIQSGSGFSPYSSPLGDEDNYPGTPTPTHACSWIKGDVTPQIKGEELSPSNWNYYLSLYSWYAGYSSSYGRKESAKTLYDVQAMTTYQVKLKYRVSDYAIGFKIRTQYINAMMNTVYDFTIPSGTQTGQWYSLTLNFNTASTGPANRIVFESKLPISVYNRPHIDFDDIEITCWPQTTATIHEFENPTATDILTHFSCTIPTVATNDIIIIRGDMTVDQDITFHNCPNILMGSESKIFVNNNIKLEIINQSHVSSVCGCMWYGIEALGNSSEVNISNATIEDAICVVTSTQAAKIDLIGSDFLNNYQILQLNGGGITNPYPGTISGNTFDASSILAHSPFAGVRPQTAIKVEFVNDITFTDNTFIGWYNGINSQTSYIKAYSNTFTDISLPPGQFCSIPIDPFKFDCPTAIFCTFPVSGFAGITNDIVIGGSSSLTNTFNNCSHGIYTYNQNTDIQYNNFEDVSVAVICRDPKDEAYVKYNDFDEIGIGVYMYCTYSDEKLVVVTNNTMSNVHSTGIHFYQIESSLRQRARIYENTIYFPANEYLPNTYGIRVQACNCIAVWNNYVQKGSYIATTPPNYEEHYGLSVESTQAGLIKQNQFVQMGNGIRVAGSCITTEFCCNQMKYDYYGILFDEDAAIDNQGDASESNGNQWYGSYGSNNERRMHSFYNPPLQFPADWFYCSPCGTAHNPYVDASHPSLYTHIIPYANSHQMLCCGEWGVIESLSETEQRDKHFLPTIQEAYTFTTLNSEYYSYSEDFILESLSKDSALLNTGTASDSIYTAYKDSLATKNVGLFNDVKNDILNGNVNMAISKNNSIMPEHSIESNIKLVNSIYLTTFAVDSFAFDSLQYSQLLDIAMQKPYTGGKAVYIARALLGIDPSMASVSYRYSKNDETMANTESETINLYPNPVEDNLFIQVSNDTISVFSIQIFDITGKLVLSDEVTTASKLFKINTKSLKKGFYVCRLTKNNTEIFNKKFIKE